MSGTRLPASIDLRKAFKRGLSLTGNIPVSAMPRLATQLIDHDSEIHVDLVFRHDDFGRRIVMGHVEGCVSLSCERCLEPVLIPLSDEISLAVVSSLDQAKQLDRDIDPWLTSDEELNLNELVEEQLLLSLPLVALHNDGPCTLISGTREFGSATISGDSQRENPFKALAQLKR